MCSLCLSVTNFDPNHLGTGRTEWDEITMCTSSKMGLFRQRLKAEVKLPKKTT